MIHPLRAAHRRTFITLAFVLPAILAVGLGARLSPPTMRGSSSAHDASYRIKKSDRLWRKHAIQTEFYRNSSFPQELDVVLKPSPELNEPDLLLYWVADAPQGDNLTEQARLLGPFHAGQVFALPHEAAQSGHLVLYSGAHQTVVDTAPLENLP